MLPITAPYLEQCFYANIFYSKWYIFFPLDFSSLGNCTFHFIGSTLVANSFLFVSEGFHYNKFRKTRTTRTTKLPLEHLNVARGQKVLLSLNYQIFED